MTGDTRFRDLGDQVANLTIGIVATGDFYRLDMYRAQQMAYGGQWSSSNPFLAPAMLPDLGNSGSVSATTNRLTISGQDWDAIINPMAVTEGDAIFFTAAQASGYGNGVTPQGATTGVTYYLKNLTGGPFPSSSTSANLSTTKGGSTLVTFTADSGADFALVPQAVHQAVAGSPLYVPQADTYCQMHAALFMLAREAGNAAATDTLKSNLVAFLAPTNRAGWMPWALAA